MELFKSRTRVAYTNAVGDKVYPVIVDIKRGIKSTEEIQFMSSDINTGILSVAFIQGNDNYNVSGAEVVCSVMRPDASTLDIPCTSVEDNIVEVPLGINGTSQDGIYSFDFKVFKGGNKVVGTPIMNYSVSLSISNDMVVEEDDRLPVLTMLMTQVTELKDEAREVINQANTATEATKVATANAIEATNNVNVTINTANQKMLEVDNAKNEMTTTVANKVNEVEGRFNALTASQQQSSEVIDARDGEISLKARLDRDIEKAKQVYVNVEGSHISTDSSSGYLKDVEIKGNTIQDASNLADIRSVGEKVEGQELYKIPVLSVGKNLFYGGLESGTYQYNNGVKIPSTTEIRSVHKIKVNPNSNYFISSNKPTGNIGVYYFDSKENFIKAVYDGGQKVVTTEDTHFIAFRFVNLDLDRTVQIEEGTVATEYEPYQEDKLTILSPTPLEKVGDVADRLIYKDGVWGVEKNVVTYHLKDFTHVNYDSFSCRTKLPTQSTDDANWKYVDFYSNLGYPHTNINLQWTNRTINSIAINNVNSSAVCDITSENYIYKDVIKMIEDNDIWVKFVTKSPQFIPLPHDQQIKLRTFANKTNISFLTEIEGTIKAQVPKSLGATVNTHTTQISNLNKELDRVKKLEESTVSTVETESDFTTVEATSNGYFEDVKLEGKTLVNLWGNKSGDFQYSGQTSFNPITQCIEYTSTTNRFSNCFTKNPNQYKTNTKYTIIVNVFENTFTSTTGILKVNSDSGGGSDLGVSRETINIQGGFLGVKVFTITTLSDLSNSNIAIRTYIDNVNAEVGAKLKFKMIILEGDHTQNPPSYFEGLKSVGQSATTSETDEIVVSSVNENLFDMNSKYEDAMILENGSKIDTQDWRLHDFIKVKPNGTYYLCDDGLNFYQFIVVLYDSNKNFIGRISRQGDASRVYTMPSNAFYCRINYSVSVTGASIVRNNIMFSEGTTPKPYTPHQSDKKRLLFYNDETQTWEKPVLREWDSIEKHANGKYYYHQRSGEVVLNGSEDWVILTLADALNDYIGFGVKCSNDFKYYTSPTPSSDFCIDNRGFSQQTINTINNVSYSGEAISFHTDGKWYLRLNKSKLSSQDVTGFKQWLQANNVTVVYQLAQEKVYECTNIDLITYTNETNYIVESGAIVPRSTLKVHNNISNVVSLLQKKVSLLESNVKASQEVQDMMILETDMRMLDIELALMEFAPMKLNLGGSNMLRSATYFNFVKNHIVNETYEKEYLENVMNKYLATGRINQDEYDELYKMLYPPVYDIELPIEP